MKYTGFALWILFINALTPVFATAAEFTVVVDRLRTEDGLIVGEVTVNKMRLGTCYEHSEKKIPARKYDGTIRTISMKNFVQGPGGRLGRTGDFLLEVKDVPNRTHILFHAGNTAKQTDGCILCGPPIRATPTADPYAPDLLKRMRLIFFDGDDTPIASPNKVITVEIRDPK